MAEPFHGPASFCTQANALLRKNLTFQKRNIKANIRLISSPLILCVLLVVMQILYNTIEHSSEQSDSKKCIPDKSGRCPMEKPPKRLPTLQVPSYEYLAARTNSIPFADLPDNSCRSHGSCPATMLFTGGNQSLGQILAGNMLPSSLTLNTSDVLGSLANSVLGSFPGAGDPSYIIQTQCSSNSTSDVQVQLSPDKPQDTRSLSCIRGLNLWRNSTKAINDELYKGYFKGNPERKINEIVAAYDFSNTDANKFNVSIWFNSSSLDESYGDDGDIREWLRVPRSINLASSAYLKFLRGPGTKILFEYVKEMPKAEQHIDVIAYFLGPLFFTWVVIQLFPVILTALVYEKQQNLRIMMKMHGLGDGPYWLISYAYFLVVSALYMLCFVIFGSAIDLKIFRLNDYSVQFAFYFVFINLQIAVAFLAAAFFSNVKSATVVGYIIVFGSGLVGKAFFESFLEKTSFSRARLIAMELYPGFSLYRGLYEFNQPLKLGTHGIRWKDLSDSSNGIAEVLIVMAVEWILVLLLAYHVDKVLSSGRGPLFFLGKFCRRVQFRKPSLRRQGSKVSIPMEKPDVVQERERVEELLAESSTSCSIISDDLKKVYPGRDGNPEKYAVRGLSLAIPRGECFGMLGPNGAGKTSFISMMIGLTKPTCGTAYIEGMDIRTQMDKIYTSMGVCPQHDLLWETLTGREHLLFYGRLKSLKGQALQQAVEESLKGVNLYYGGVADKQAGKYSGGMKRRLSVAISLIGDPKVVYMDEPSTGLDPASRNKLWNVVKRAKPDRAIILTTHSMEEAEVLCDRLGIFVNGSLQCIGNSRELKGRYGGSYVFTITTSSAHEEEVENLVKHLSPSAKRIYQISGTQKFELPKHEVRISEVFEAVEYAKSRFTVYAWGLADTTLEDVFIKVARGAQAANVPS